MSFVFVWLSMGAHAAPEPGAAPPVEAPAEAPAPPVAAPAPPPAPPVEAHTAGLVGVGPAEVAPPAPVPAMARLMTNSEVEVPASSGDVVAMGNTVRVVGDVGDNALLLGRTVTVRNPVRGDVIAMGQIIKIDAPIGGDLYTMGAEIHVTDNGSIGGNVLGTAQRIVLEGEVQGEVAVRTEQLELGGPIHGDASLVFGQLDLGKAVALDGDLRYIAPNPAPALEKATKGASKYSLAEDMEVSTVGGPVHLAQRLVRAVLGAVGSYLAQLLVGAGMLLLLGEFARRPARTIAEQPLISLVLGGAALVAIPLLTIVVGFLFARLGFIDLLSSMVTAATPPLAAAAATVWGFGFIVGRILTALMIGEWLLGRFAPARKDNSTAALAAGLVPLVVLSAFPWLGVAVWGVATALGLGGTWLYLRVASKTGG